jgi:hypothetical protein
MPDDPEVEFGRIRAVLRGLRWEVTSTEVTKAELVVTARYPRPPEPAAASPR